MTKFRIRYCTWDPYTVKHTRSNNKTSVGGIVGDIYQGMKAFVGLDYEAELQPDNIFGRKNEDGSWSGMLGSMIRNESDITGPFFITEERSLEVEYSVPLGFAQIGILTGLVPSNENPFLIFEIFSTQVWMSFLLSVLLVSCCASFIYHVLPSSEKRPKTKVFFKYMWAFQTSAIGKSVGSRDRWFLRHVWSSPSFRVLQCVWYMCACVVLMYTYQGSVTSVFTSSKLRPRIQSIEDLLEDTEMRVGTFRYTYVDTFFQQLDGTRYASVWLRLKSNLPANDPDEPIQPWMELVARGEQVFLADSQFLRNSVGKRFLETGKCELRVITTDLGSTYIGIAFRKHFKDSALLRDFNRILRRFNEGSLGHFGYLKSHMNYDVCTGMSVTDVNPLNLFDDLIGAFVVLFTGLVLSIISLLIEIINHNVQ